MKYVPQLWLRRKLQACAHRCRRCVEPRRFTALTYCCCCCCHEYTTFSFLCLPKLRSQDTPMQRLNRSTQRATVLKKEASDISNFVENHISHLSTAFRQLTGRGGSLITKFKASASQPINDLMAAGNAAMRDAEAAAASAQRDRDQIKASVDEIAAETGRKETQTQAAAAAKANNVDTPNHKLLPRLRRLLLTRRCLKVNAVNHVETSRAGYGNPCVADSGE